jgi:hypothetical protein
MIGGAARDQALVGAAREAAFPRPRRCPTGKSLPIIGMQSSPPAKNILLPIYRNM